MSDSDQKSFAGFRCDQCGTVGFSFPQDAEERLPKENAQCKHVWTKLPPSVTVILATNTYMSDPQFDSLKTIYELDRQLNIEARDEKEAQVYQAARRLI